MNELNFANTQLVAAPVRFFTFQLLPFSPPSFQPIKLSMCSWPKGSYDTRSEASLLLASRRMPIDSIQMTLQRLAFPKKSKSRDFCEPSWQNYPIYPAYPPYPSFPPYLTYPSFPNYPTNSPSKIGETWRITTWGSPN